MTMFRIIAIVLLMTSFGLQANPMQPPPEALKRLKAKKAQPAASLKPPVVAPQDNAVKKPPVIYELQSILNSNERQVAIINNKALSVGQTVSGAKLKKIGKNQVWLIRNGKTLIVKLKSAQAETITIKQ